MRARGRSGVRRRAWSAQAAAGARSIGSLALLVVTACSGEAPTPAAGAGELAALARCLAERGVVYYGASGCKACRTQKRSFGAAFAEVVAIECHPHAPGSETEHCVERGIRVTPTWLLEPAGREAGRLEGARGPAELATFAGCPWTGSEAARP